MNYFIHFHFVQTKQSQVPGNKNPEQNIYEYSEIVPLYEEFENIKTNKVSESDIPKQSTQSVLPVLEENSLSPKSEIETNEATLEFDNERQSVISSVKTKDDDSSKDYDVFEYKQDVFVPPSNFEANSDRSVADEIFKAFSDLELSNSPSEIPDTKTVEVEETIVAETTASPAENDESQFNKFLDYFRGATTISDESLPSSTEAYNSDSNGEDEIFLGTTNPKFLIRQRRSRHEGLTSQEVNHSFKDQHIIYGNNKLIMNDLFESTYFLKKGKVKITYI